MPLPVMVGAERAEILRHLVSEFDAACETGESRVVCIAGGMGWGKTRLVQEFYARLASDRQPEGRYWPPTMLPLGGEDDILAERKRIHPHVVKVPAGVQIPWMWWGITCGRLPDGRPLPALRTEQSQFEAHIAPIVARLQRRKVLVKESLATLGALAGFLVPDPIQALQACRKMLGVLYRHLVAGYEDFATRHQHQRRIDPDAEGDADLVEETAGSIRTVCRPDFPLVLVVDDAHWADEATIRLIEAVSTTEAPVLVIALAWPEELRRRPGGETSKRTTTFGAWLDSRAGIRPGMSRVDLSPLRGDDLRHIVLEIAPKTDDGVVNALCARADGNPFVLRLMLGTDVVVRAIVEDAIEIDPAEIAELPNSLWEHFAGRLRSLTPKVRGVIVIAADQGERFARQPVLAAATAVGIDREERAFARAVAPESWFRHELSTLFRFAEHVLFEVAVDKRPEILTRSQLQRSRVAACEAIRAIKSDAGWTAQHDRVRWSLLDLHVRLAEMGAEENWTAAAASAGELSEIERRDFELPRAAQLAELALRWIREHGPQDPRLELGQELTLARVMAADGRRSEAGDIRRSVFARASSLFPPEDEIVVRAKRDLARTLATGDIEDQRQARTLREDVLAWVSQRHPDGSAPVIEAKQALAMSLGALGDELALELREQVISQLESTTHPHDHDYLRALTNLAYTYSMLGRHDEALALRRRVLNAREEIFGERHPALAGALVNLAATLRKPDLDATAERRDRLDEAVRLAERARDIRLEALGRQHHRTWIAMAALAGALFARWELDNNRADDLTTAHDLMVEVLRNRQEHFSENHRRTIQARERLARILHAQGRTEEALACVELAGQSATQVLIDGHGLRADVSELLDSLRDEGRPG